jgi:hypothetical protein
VEAVQLISENSFEIPEIKEENQEH